jgi:hypothetical protein
MSKEAALRAMREANFTQRSKVSGATSKAAKAAEPTRPAKAAKPAKPAARPSKAAADSAAPSESSDGLCGHRSMNGRSCTREHGHAAKSHRYT